jgi:hypothetical protein
LLGTIQKLPGVPALGQAASAGTMDGGFSLQS